MLLLLNPVRNLSEPTKAKLRRRLALALTGPEGMIALASAVTSSAVSAYTASSNLPAVESINKMVSETGGHAYAAAGLAIVEAGHLNLDAVECKVVIIGGQEDYLTSISSLESWVAELPTGRTALHLLDDVGHWAAIEAPERVGKILQLAAT